MTPLPDPSTYHVRLCGAETHANDPLEAWVNLAGIPRVGDQIEIWDGRSEVWETVADVSWPAWQYEHDPGVQGPTITLQRADGLSDEEWRDLFAAIRERRHP